MKPSEVMPGAVFKYASAPGDGLETQEMFLRIFAPGGEGPNALNLATWSVAEVDWEEEVVILGGLRANLDYFPNRILPVFGKKS